MVGGKTRNQVTLDLTIHAVPNRTIGLLRSDQTHFHVQHTRAETRRAVPVLNLQSDGRSGTIYFVTLQVS